MRLVTCLIVSSSLLVATAANAVSSNTPGGCPMGTTPIPQPGGTFSEGASAYHVWYYCKPAAPIGGAGPCPRGASKAPPGGYKKQASAKSSGC